MAIIDKPSDYFNTKLYTGDGGTQSVTGVGFQPDWTWIKNRGSTDSHNVYDAVRGVTKYLLTNNTVAEGTTSGVTAFNSDGFSVGNNSMTNSNSNNYASWNWLANGAGSANTDGNVNTTVSANATAGFSIVKYTGNGSQTATFGHGLNAVPKMILLKKLNASADWVVYHEAITSANRLILNSTAAQESSANWRATPTNTVFNSNASNIINNSGDSYIAYVFANVTGYSKFGSYVGNGNSDGTFTYTGFKPAFVIIKRSDGAANWELYDSKRLGYNSSNPPLYPDLGNAEGDNGRVDILSNGFKIVTTSGNLGASGGTYIYMCFASEPLVGDNPATAR